MGRPVNKKHFGIVSGSDNNFVVTVKVGTNAVSAVGIIKRQRGSNKFMVDDANDDSGNEGVCRLVDKDINSLNDNEMSLTGYIGGAGDGVRLRKVFNKTAIDFSGVRYKWAVTDDSTSSQMVLTAV